LEHKKRIDEKKKRARRLLNVLELGGLLDAQEAIEVLTQNVIIAHCADRVE